jgi:meiotically up-regulated gene 157 (Mug157) protein
MTSRRAVVVAALFCACALRASADSVRAYDDLRRLSSCAGDWDCSSVDSAPAGAPAGAITFESVKREAAALKLADAHEAAIFRAGLLNAGKQASWASDGTVYVKTGDIPAEWLRDSSAQIAPYLYFAKDDPAVAAFLRAVIARQGRMLARDPYANAFREDYSVWEEKFELDSLANPIILAARDWRATSDTAAFTPDVQAGFAAALETMRAEQDHASAPRGYKHPALKNNPAGHTGMIWTGFRPSDDPCVYNYLIPAEMMAVTALGDLAEIEDKVWHDGGKAALAARLRDEVRAGIERYGRVKTARFGEVYAYEVDGLGHSLLMDDANIPSLLASPTFGYGSASDEIYLNTRRLILSTANPYYYTGKTADGIGSPHTPKGMVWPLALIAQAETATSPAEKERVEKELTASDPGDGRLHESFDPNNPKRYTRPDFGWPNSLFAEYVLTEHGGFKKSP